MSSVRIKTCGMWRPEDIAAVNAARPDYCGFVVNFPKSHRNVSPGQVKDLRALLSPEILAVGVFVDQDPQLIADMVADGSIDVVQLHGHEDEGYIADLRTRCQAPIFKAFKVRSAEDLAAAQASSADMVLLDNGYGTGQTFDWNLADGFARPFILAGGLNPENLADAVSALQPWGVDLSSGLEIDKVKDADLIAQAVAAVK